MAKIVGGVDVERRSELFGEPAELERCHSRAGLAHQRLGCSERVWGLEIHSRGRYTCPLWQQVRLVGDDDPRDDVRDQGRSSSAEDGRARESGGPAAGPSHSAGRRQRRRRRFCGLRAGARAAATGGRKALRSPGSRRRCRILHSHSNSSGTLDRSSSPPHDTSSHTRQTNGRFRGSEIRYLPT